jgi:branched-chain amino acid transport system permease protein
MGYLLTFLCRLFENIIFGASAHLTISVGGIIFLATPALAQAGAYGLIITQKASGSLLLGLGAALALTLLMGFIYAYAYQKLSADSYAVFTLTSALAFDGLIRSWDTLTGGVLGIVGISRPSFATSLIGICLLQFIVVLIFIGVYILFFKSAFGRQARALRENKAHLDALGISSQRVATKTIVLACVFAAISGVLAVWRIQFLDPTYGGIPPLILAITIAIMAYGKQWKGLLLSTFVITALPELLRFAHFPSGVIGNARVILYSAIVIALLHRLASKENSPLRNL